MKWASRIPTASSSAGVRRKSASVLTWSLMRRNQLSDGIQTQRSSDELPGLLRVVSPTGLLGSHLPARCALQLLDARHLVLGRRQQLFAAATVLRVRNHG